MKCAKLLSKPSTKFWVSKECIKFVMDKMCQIAQQAKYKILGIDGMYKIRDG